MSFKTVEIKAKNEQEALKLAEKILAEKREKDLTETELEVKLIAEKGFLFFKFKNIYQVKVKETISTESDEFLSETVSNIKIDGQLKLSIRDEGIYLKITKAQGDGKNISYQEIKEALVAKEIVEVDWQTIEEELDVGEEKWIKIAPRLKELDQDTVVEVDFSSNKLEAYLTYQPAKGGKELDYEEIKTVVNKQGVEYGLKEDVLKMLIKKKKPVKKVKIAEGKAPVPGKDAKLIYNFETKKESVGTIRENGSIDFFNLGLINNVQAGDVVVSKKDAQAGQDGIAVTSETIVAPKVKDIKLPTGKNVEAKNEKQLIASKAGQVVLSGKKVNVLPVYELNQDVDLATGNIDFVGNVLINASVLEGFAVKAEGNVEIKGYVYGANIESSGSVVIHKGFMGKNKYKIKAKGDVKVKFVENGIIATDKSIYVSDAVMHSQLVAGNKIVIKENKGLLVGGESKASYSIEANIIGSSLATTTSLEVGLIPKLSNKIKNLENELKEAQENIKKAIKGLNHLNQLKNKLGQLPVKKQNIYNQLEKSRETLSQIIKEKQEKLDLLLEETTGIKGEIIVREKMFPGSKVIIANSHYNIEAEISCTRFIEEKGEIRQVPL